MWQCAQAMASAGRSNTSLDVAAKHSADMINTNNRLTLNKRYYSQSCGWASPYQMTALTEKTGVPWRKNPAWVSSLPSSPTDFRLAGPTITACICYHVESTGLCLCFSGEPGLAHSASTCTSCLILYVL